MDTSAREIHEALEAVSLLRQRRAADPALAEASLAIKRFQALRFQATYADLREQPRYDPAVRFFLHELYSDKDYAERDQQFARIANTIARLFPEAVVTTAAALAGVHALTEELDDAMARQWLAIQTSHLQELDGAGYMACWRRVADPAARQQQLQVVLQLGHELERLTRMRGLRMLLRMMHRPAAAAGLTSLQQFLEAGFDAFATMNGSGEFLRLIETRESSWIASLFEDDAVTCETKLRQLFSAGRSH
ncbi:FFLEELY motif protein [Polaromonas sp.]|uniref:FFLEELY motif protein n=1 Tax=Polaromonas sp. TaxID=1869339 RepID=UPI002FCACE99